MRAARAGLPLSGCVEEQACCSRPCALPEHHQSPCECTDVDKTACHEQGKWCATYASFTTCSLYTLRVTTARALCTLFATRFGYLSCSGILKFHCNILKMFLLFGMQFSTTHLPEPESDCDDQVPHSPACYSQASQKQSWSFLALASLHMKAVEFLKAYVAPSWVSQQRRINSRL